MQTLGDVVTFVLILAGLIVVPYKLAKAWLWPPVRDLFRSFVTSSGETSEDAKTAAVSVHVPVRDTGTEGGTAWELPRISRHNSDAERIVYLAAQLSPDGKYRFSANKIADLIGGTRADVLEQVKGVRTSPSYAALTPDKQPALN
jgi:hypothetical protein